MATGVVEPTESPTLAAVEAARESNRRNRACAPSDSDEPAPFWCECTDDHCYSTVWLTSAQYDAIVASDEFVLAEGHESLELD